MTLVVEEDLRGREGPEHEALLVGVSQRTPGVSTETSPVIHAEPPSRTQRIL